MTYTSKRERLEARVSPDQKALMQRAAAIEGRSLTDFMLDSIQTAAYEVIRQHELISLTTRDSTLFVESLMEPRTPNGQLRAEAERHRTLISE